MAGIAWKWPWVRDLLCIVFPTHTTSVSCNNSESKTLLPLPIIYNGGHSSIHLLADNNIVGIYSGHPLNTNETEAQPPSVGITTTAAFKQGRTYHHCQRFECHFYCHSIITKPPPSIPRPQSPPPPVIVSHLCPAISFTHSVISGCNLYWPPPRRV